MESPQITGSTLDGDLSVLASQRRRLILQYLDQESTNPLSIDELVDHLVDNSSERTLGRKSIEIELHHKHLPKLEEYGLIEYDPRSGDVQSPPDAPLDRLLECLPGD
jgi:hypothetical protein